jgi:hypothetical protein
VAQEVEIAPAPGGVRARNRFSAIPRQDASGFAPGFGKAFEARRRSPADGHFPVNGND